MSFNWWNTGYSYWGDDDDLTSDPLKPKDRKFRYRSSLGWSPGKLIDTTSSYFKYDYKKSSSGHIDDKRIDLVSKSYKAVRDFVVILDFPFNVDIQLSAYVSHGVDSKNSKRIFIPSKVLDDSKYDDQEKVNIFCGLGIHEAIHLKFTEYRVLKNFKEKCESDPSSIGVSSEYRNSHHKFLMSLINIIEDERIEDKLLKQRPGYMEFIEKEKLYKYSEFLKKSKSVMKDYEQMRLVNNLYRLIRFPQNIELDVVEKYSEFYEKVKNILTPLPESTKETCKAGLAIYNEVLRLFKELKLEYPIPDEDDAFERLGLLGEACFDEVIYGFDHDSGLGIPSDKISELFDSTIVEKLVTGFATKGVNGKTYFEKIKGRKDPYQDSLNRVSKYIPSIRKLIKGTDKNYEFTIRGCRHGLLDTDKLAEAYQGVPQVYIRKGIVKTNKTTVCVLVDESGSMSSNGRLASGYRGTRSKASLARDAVILLNESLKNLPGVDLYIYGHTADVYDTGDTVLNIYKEGDIYSPDYALSEIRGRRENRDGNAIFETAKRVRKFTESNCIMFVISDGSPCAHNYYGMDAEEDVKKQVSAVENMGFKVIQVSIDDVHNVKNMFTNIVDLKMDIANLPKNLSQVIKKVIVDDKTTTVS